MRYLRFIVILSILSILLLWVGTTLAAKTPTGKGLTTAECLACRNDSSSTKDVNGKSASLYVNEVKLKSSIHGSRCSNALIATKTLRPFRTSPRRLR